MLMGRFANFKYYVSISLLAYGGYFYYIAKDSDAQRYRVSLSRRVSRFTGYVTSMPLPPGLRMGLYRAFGSVYGVKFDEMLVENLNDFRTFNQFFTRELKPSARTIDDTTNNSTLSSPCDGKVLSYGEVDTLAATMDCIKGNNYRVDEFLFGYQTK